MGSLYHLPVTALARVGPKKEKLFLKLGVDSVGSLLRLYPRTYEDWSHRIPIAQTDGISVCCVKARVEKVFPSAKIRNNMILYKILVTDGFDFLTITFFNQGYLCGKLELGRKYLFYGVVKRVGSQYVMSSPSVGEVDCNRIRPVYPQTGTLFSSQIEDAMKQALILLPQTINDPIPQAIREQYGLLELGEALRQVHFPDHTHSVLQAKRRLSFEELLILQLGLARLNGSRQHSSCHHVENDRTDEFVKLLPFSLTGAQQRAIRDCIDDMKNLPYPMNRLIQGDVGSGKTAVAAAVCYSAVKNGMQCAFMAPTEILAKQHFQALSELLSPTGVRLALLTGSAKAAEKRRIKDWLSVGVIDLVIGTHALISEDVSFSRLGLVVTDEQHRFGVAQRAALISKGDSPHMLVMSATPIPRTLALMIFGDLDLSVLDELPPGRQKVDTFLVDSSKRNRIYRFMHQHVREGKQCYIVCPLVEKKDIDLLSAEEYAEKLLETELSHCRIAVLHGKMKPAEKEKIMKQFVEGTIDVLVATTVIEVGVNVPNAVIMLIENAERFGLSQLHQLRGRVGRGKDKSYCILVSDHENETTRQRLSVMCRTNDGFQIADEDLRLRGPGDFFGSRQHGLPELNCASMSDMVTLKEAEEAARRILKEDPSLSLRQNRALRFETERLFASVGAAVRLQ